MSDSIEDLAKHYEKNVYDTEHTRSIGLFTIPEYPELEADRGMWSAALDAILTTLRYLAPATLLTLFWGQQSFLFKILKHIDSAFRAIVFSSEEQKLEVLQWLAEAGPVRVEHLDTVWRHGWILCSVLDAALPGACAGHPPTRLNLKHAQAIADHYLGVEPVFSRQDLESNDSLSRHQEWKLATYLDRVRQTLSKLTPPVSKPVSERTSPETSQFTLDYVAKGSGLSAAQVHNRAYFKIYPTAQQALDPGQITILIRGPKDTYGMAVLPPILGKAQMIRQKLLGLQSKQNFTENILPITQGATYLRSYGKNDMNKTYYIPKTKYDIDINVEIRTDHAKICYKVNIEGKYEVSITSRGLNIVGSPFEMTASDDIVSTLEKDTFCLEDGEEIDIVDVKTDRKVVLRIVDFVTEKMLLRENGTLEKITDDEAKILMTTDIAENEMLSFDSEPRDTITGEEIHTYVHRNKFNTVAQKILAMNRVCKVFNDLKDENQMQSDKKEYFIPRGQQDIPDIVNSTLSEVNVNSYVLPENRDKYIVPESITVSLRTEKSKHLDDEEELNTVVETGNAEIGVPIENTECDYSNSSHSESHEEQIDDNISIDRMTSPSTKNPFLNDVYEDSFVAAQNFGTFVTSEYERNNFQNEETRESSITIVIDPANTSQIPQNNNPFINADTLEFKRPTTPVFKIISGENLNRDETGYINPKSESESEEALANEFVNPFFMHHLQSNQHEQTLVTDFIIGAPVSLPPIISASSPEPVLKSLIMTENENLKIYKTQDAKLENVKVGDLRESVLTTPEHTNLNVPERNQTDQNSTESLTFHSLESNLTNNSTASTSSDNQFEGYHISDQNLTPRKDIWDSAYVSIDDNNSSPDSNNNESTMLSEISSKHKSPIDDNHGLKQEEICNMGPAERELWQTCNELKCATNRNQEDVKPYKWEIKRPMFTPIIEESDRSISSGAKDLLRSDVGMKHETETISVAFAELNDIYQEYFPNSETSSTTVANEDGKLQSMEKNYAIKTEDVRVDSASELSDVKRREEDLEGEISEVQANATESVSVSQTLRDDNEDFEYNTQNKAETQFGDSTHSNLVLEKKMYWDERIRQIEAKSAETPTLQKKKRIYSKQLKHDSLSKRRGKQMIKNFLSAGGYSQFKNNSEFDKEVVIKATDITCKEPDTQPNLVKQVNSDEKLVRKWKQYWDTKLQSENEVSESTLSQHKSPKNKSNMTSPPPIVQAINKIEISLDEHDGKKESQINNQPRPVKQEIPEEVFKAFETSPKRFFGTCRKHILNKMDTFLGKPVPVDKSPADDINICHESGLVSSRISLFHNMSNTEDLPWARRKCQSLHDIHRKESEKSASFVVDTFRAQQSKSTQPVIIRENESSIDRANERVLESVSIQNKRARMMHSDQHKSFEVDCQKVILDQKHSEKSQHMIEKNTEITNEDQSEEFKGEILRKTSFSKSEMDIFNKVPNEPTDDYLDKYKSCDELPKINVKSFISLYESVSNTAVEPRLVKRIHKTNSVDSHTILQNVSTTSDAVHKTKAVSKAVDPSMSRSESKDIIPRVTPEKRFLSKDAESVSNASFETETSDCIDIEIISSDNKQTTYLSLSDIELEIIETCSDKSSESSPERTAESSHIDYKSRFKSAKQYFQSLEELREPNARKSHKLNECELLLRKQSTESLENERPQKRVKKNIKSLSLPSSEISKIWNQLQESQDNNTNTKLVKISEKFHVDDLFTDVTEGKLSRQGSLRGIPHKKAVLEAFRSMENVAVTNINSYEIAESQLTDFAKEYRVKNAQTYLAEYPYLPTTDPSKYHSRLDTKASGLITFKELLGNKPRRNSVPDLRLNLKFTEDL